MKNIPQIAICLFLCAPVLPAQTTPHEVITGQAGEAVDGKNSGLSQKTSASVQADFQYTSVPEEKKNEEPVDLREVDKPQNTIIRLPSYLVEAQRPPVFQERNLYSKEMLRRLAYHRYISAFSRNVLNRYRLPFIGGGIDAYANMMYEAEERQRNMADTDDRVAMYRISGDTEEAKALRDEANSTYLRKTQFIAVPSGQR